MFRILTTIFGFTIIGMIGWFNWFNEPQIIERFIEIPVEVEVLVEKTVEVPVKIIEYIEVPKIITKIEYVPVEKIVTEVIIEPANPNLVIKLHQWEKAFDELKPVIYTLVSASSTQGIITAFKELEDEYGDIHTQHTLLLQSNNLDLIPYIKVKLPEVESCYFSTTDDIIPGVAKGKIVCN